MLILVSTLASAQEFRIPGFGTNNSSMPSYGNVPYGPGGIIFPQYYVFPPRPRRTTLEMADDPRCEKDDRNAALMIIDMQDSFALRGKRALLRANAAISSSVLDEQIKAIEAARKADLPIIIVEYANASPTSARLKAAVQGYSKAKIIEKTTDGVFDGYNLYRKDLAK